MTLRFTFIETKVLSNIRMTQNIVDHDFLQNLILLHIYFRSTADLLFVSRSDCLKKAVFWVEFTLSFRTKFKPQLKYRKSSY